MFRVVVDATPISPKPSGIGLYVANLIHQLYSLQNQEFQLEIAYQPGMKSWLTGKLDFPDYLKQYPHLHLLPLPVTISNLIARFPNPLTTYLEGSFGYPDIVHGTNYVVYPCRKSLRVMTIHDLTCIKYPNYIHSVVKSYADRIKQCLKWTNLVIAVSESTKRDIVEYLNVDPERIYVTPQASRYSDNYLSAERAQQLQNLCSYDFSKPYLLFVSTIEPRKNIDSLLRAFNLLKETHKLEHQLVLIGQKGWFYQTIFQTIESLPCKHHIHYLGYLADELVALFYSKADVFVYPSYYEGFGLPVLEAMKLGAPVITSNTSALPEVAGDAAILINPNDLDQLADAILRVVSDSQVRQNLIQKGRERAKLFSWERTALETVNAYKSLMS